MNEENAQANRSLLGRCPVCQTTMPPGAADEILGLAAHLASAHTKKQLAEQVMWMLLSVERFERALYRQVGSDEPSRRRAPNTIPTLTKAGLLKPGSVIRMLPQYLPLRAKSTDAKFNARVGDDESRVVWEPDQRVLTITELTKLLREQGARGIPAGSINGALYWGLPQWEGFSLSDLAEMYRERD